MGNFKNCEGFSVCNNQIIDDEASLKSAKIIFDLSSQAHLRQKPDLQQNAIMKEAI